MKWIIHGQNNTFNAQKTHLKILFTYKPHDIKEMASTRSIPITLGLSSNQSIESLEMVHSLAVTYEDFVRNKRSGIS
jgi:hypothetical protein